MANKMVQKDERTNFTEMASYSYGYKFLAFGLLFDIMYKSFRFNESSWDLFSIIIVSGFVMTLYQYKQKILGTSWIKTVTLTIVIAIIAAIVLTLS
jgi:Fe2+ transport system protein B